MADSLTHNHAAARPSAHSLLAGRGYRTTGPRRAVTAEVLRQPQSFTAESVAVMLPLVGRATVFRTIKILLDSGAICKLPMPDGTFRYQLAQVGHHHHAVCTKCGAIRELKAEAAERAVRALNREVDDIAVGHRIELYVVCANCRKNYAP